jgi:hypothetical protein
MLFHRTFNQTEITRVLCRGGAKGWSCGHRQEVVWNQLIASWGKGMLALRDQAMVVVLKQAWCFSTTG